MKNSAWYTKLWRSKLDKLPVKTDADTAWTQMQQLLNKQLPVNSSPGGGSAAKPFLAKLPGLLMYILPLAVIISGAVYFALKANSPVVNKKVKKQTGIIKSDSANRVDLIKDSIYNESLKIDTDKTQTKVSANREKAVGENPVNVATTSGRPLGVSVSESIGTMINSPDINTGSPVLSIKNNGYLKLDSATIETQKGAMVKSVIADTPDTLSANANAHISKIPDPASKKLASANNLAKSKAKNPKPAKQPKLKSKNATATDEPDLTYGIKLGFNRGSTKNISFGVFSSYRIRPKWFIEAEVSGNTGKTVTGNFSHESYFLPDSIAPFSVSSSRKLYTVDIPISIRYKISNILSIKAGPVINIPVKQSAITNRITDLPDGRDTLYHGKEIMTSLAKTSISPKINIGISAGVNITIKRFIIEGRYMQHTPYTLTSGLGSYKVRSQYFQISLGYQLNKKRKN